MKKYLFFILIVFIASGTLSVVLAASSTVSGNDAKSLRYADKVMAISGELKSFHNQLSNLNLKKAKSAADFNKMVNIAKTRRFLMLQLAKEAPRLFMERALKKAERSTLPPIVQPFIESEVALSGKMDVIHIDDFDNPENSRFDYFLRVGKQKFNFYPTKQLYLASDTGVKLQGFQLDNIVVANIGEETFSVVSEPPKPDSVGDQKTLVFLIDFPDSGTRPFTREKAYNLVFNDQFQAFMKEQSYNQVSFSGYVTDWITKAQRSNSDLCGGAYLSDSEIFNYIINNSIDLSNYNRIIYLVFYPGYIGGCSTVGKTPESFNNKTYYLSQAWVGADYPLNPSIWGSQPFEWKNIDYVLAHELGHSLGVLHANGWDCGDQTLYGNCQHLEYYNFFDTMGTRGFSLHFNAFYKELLGWINSAQALLIDKAGTYAINPLETNTGYNLAKIQVLNSTTTPFYVEYRKGIGFDANLNNSDLVSNQTGLFVNNIVKLQWRLPFPRLLDMQPTLQYWWDDTKQTVLNTNQKFEDAGSGVTIGSVKNADSASITFDIALNNPTCVRSQPSIQRISYPFNFAAGSSGGMSISFINADSQLCGSSEFEFIPIMPAGFTVNSSYAPSMVAPQESGWLGIDFSSPTTLGTYSIGYDLINKNSGLKTSGSVFINVVAPPVISALNPSKGSPGTTVQINGSGFTGENYTYFQLNGINWYSASAYSADGTTLTFQIPSSIYTFACNCYTSTTAGLYQMQVYANSASSNTVNFEVFFPPTLTINPISTSTLIGKTVKFTAFYDPDGIGAKSAINVTTSTIWSSASTSIATINSSGVASAVKFGTTTMTTLYGGLEGLVSKAKLAIGKEVVWPSSNVARNFTVYNLCENTWRTTSNHSFTLPPGSNYVTGEVGDDTVIYRYGRSVNGEVRVTLNANGQTCQNVKATGANNRAKCTINFPSPLQASSSALISAAFRVTDSSGACSSDYVVNYDYNCNGICGILARYPLYPVDNSAPALASFILPQNLGQQGQSKTYAIYLNQMANILESAKSTLMGILNYLQSR